MNCHDFNCADSRPCWILCYFYLLLLIAIVIHLLWPPKYFDWRTKWIFALVLSLKWWRKKESKMTFYFCLGFLLNVWECMMLLSGFPFGLRPKDWQVVHIPFSCGSLIADWLKRLTVPQTRFISVVGWEAPLLQTFTAGTHVRDHTLIIIVAKLSNVAFVKTYLDTVPKHHVYPEQKGCG